VTYKINLVKKNFHKHILLLKIYLIKIKNNCLINVNKFSGKWKTIKLKNIWICLLV